MNLLAVASNLIFHCIPKNAYVHSYISRLMRTIHKDLQEYSTYHCHAVMYILWYLVRQSGITIVRSSPVRRGQLLVFRTRRVTLLSGICDVGRHPYWHSSSFWQLKIHFFIFTFKLNSQIKGNGERLHNLQTMESDWIHSSYGGWELSVGWLHVSNMHHAWY